jgi:hypothetical protein
LFLISIANNDDNLNKFLILNSNYGSFVLKLYESKIFGFDPLFLYCIFNNHKIILTLFENFKINTNETIRDLNQYYSVNKIRELFYQIIDEYDQITHFAKYVYLFMRVYVNKSLELKIPEIEIKNQVKIMNNSLLGKCTKKESKIIKKSIMDILTKLNGL